MSGGAKSLVDKFDDLDGSDYSDPNSSLPNEPVDDTEDDDDSGQDDGSGDRSQSGDSDDTDTDEDLIRPKSVKKEPADKEPPKQTKDGKPIKNTNDPNKDRAEIRRLANGVHVDAKGNVVDPRDGTIIARAGSERRLFEKNMRTDTQLQDVNRQLAEAKTQLDTYKYLDGVPAKFGLDSNDVQTAMALAAVYKKDPVEAARNMVEMVLALGHNVTDILGNDVGNALEMKAVKAMLDERLAPIVKPQEDQRQAQAREAAAERAMQTYLDTHEGAELHLPVLDRMMGENPNLTPERAYYELKLFCQKNGFDFDQPLQPQLAARKSGGGSQQQQPADKRRASLPNGRSTESSQRTIDDTQQASVDQSWGDIIKSSMVR